MLFKINQYTVYLNATDEVVAVGTAYDCAKKLNMSPHGFYSMVSKCRKGKNKKYTVYTEYMDEELKNQKRWYESTEKQSM